MVKKFRSKDFFADVYCHGLRCSNDFILHTTVTVNILHCVTFMALVDTSHESIHVMLRVNYFNLNTLFRHYVAL